MAATDSKPALSALKTPVSATYPSELRSPMVFSATTPTFANLKKEDAIKTPITPPTAYLDFLKTLSPVLMSPMSTGTSEKFVFQGNRPTSMASVTSSASSGSFTMTSGPADKSSVTSTPATSRASSCSNCDHIKQEPKEQKMEPPMTAPLPKEQPKEQTVTIPPPSPFRRPSSARTPRLYIPQSPYHSPANARSPASANSANSANSPYSAVSPRTWEVEKKTGRTRRVSVREVVTRTVTYSSTPVETKAPSFPQIDPAPRGKRRKLE
ncbi:uncharacterized protein N0V89_012400 [Didymosphaeria variabile]|uniref:Uncharacterized protein n=1 Tax=Didymosphaeria variabile TaxID=1932322 RepID=A0A9W9C5D8_9PLEO|nr:uncharacterized protein N0V89_012400 [Didymosphaeria variabile]KAJ4344656.1 hypothetical protein N0V89_012400 [Didymosphaeria variabile]